MRWLYMGDHGMALYGRSTTQETIIEDKGKTLSVRSECLGTCGKIFQAVGVAIPPTIREL